jgi:hypothetical protein
MGEVLRKDYGSGAIIGEGNRVMRRLSQMNAPDSVQARGISLDSDVLEVKDYATIEAGDRFLRGNRIEVVTEVVLDEEDSSFTSATTVYTNLKGEEVTTIYNAYQMETNNVIVAKFDYYAVEA